jgi:NAD(P)-dependent dehydrogenase (short-subunit alcohol dehydrogenase family)
MAMDLAPAGIRVNCVCPGPIWTPALRRVVAEAGLAEDEYLRVETPKILLGRIGEPDEVAAAALFLASDEASYVTGASLLVDGGYCAS